MKTTKSKKQIFRSRLPIKKYGDGSTVTPQPKDNSDPLKWNQFQMWAKEQKTPTGEPYVGNTAMDHTPEKPNTIDPNELMTKWNTANPNKQISQADVAAAQKYSGTLKNDNWYGSQTSQYMYPAGGGSYKFPSDAKEGQQFEYPTTLGGKKYLQKATWQGGKPVMGDISPIFAFGGKIGDNIRSKFGNENVGQDIGQFVGNTGKAVADTALSTVGLSNVIKDDDYNGVGSNAMRTGANVAGGITKSLAPMVANMIVPGSGAFVSAGQKALGSFNPQDQDAQYQQQQGNQFGQMANMGVQMAGMFGEGGINQYTTINVEGKELEVKNGKLIRDFKGKPKHPDMGIDGDGNVRSTIGNIIIPTKLRDKYLGGDKILRSSIEHNLVQDQKLREQDETELSDKIYSNGGSVYVRPRDKKLFKPAAKRAGMDVEDYMNELTTKKFGNGGMTGGNMPQDANSDLEEHSLPIYMFKDGGINIKPSHRGRFTAYKARTGQSTEQALHSSNPHVRQMANFARNASHWKKKQMGGPVKMGEGGGTQYTNNQGMNLPIDYVNNDNNMFADDSNMPNMNINSPVGQMQRDNTIGNMSGAQADRQGNPNQFNWQDSLNTAATYAPTAYNLGRGLLDKPTQYNPHQYMDESMIPYRDINFDPIKNSIYQERNTAKANAANASGGGAGNYLSNAVQIGVNTQNSLANAMMKAQEYNSANRFNVDQSNRSQRNLNNQTKLSISQINAMNKAKKSEFLGKGLEGASALAQNNTLMKNQKAASDMGMKSLSDMFDNYTYDEKSGHWIPRIK